MRVVSDILSSNGSTSMGSVCASSLALMDGGVPTHAPVSGIAMGLIYENGKYTTLTDIQGVEDFFGDMDFKVAGPEGFITALQLDTKLAGIPANVLQDALLQARDARMEILDVMNGAISEPREEVAETAPRVEIVYIPQDKIGDVIGPRGKIIKELVEETGAQIDVDEEAGRGIVKIYADSKDVAQHALDKVNAIANPTLPEAGERYHATVVKTVDFGAFVSLTPGIDGLLHISEMSKMAGKRLNHGEEAAEVGQQILVEIKEVLDGGRKFKLAYVGDEPRRDGDEARQGREGRGSSDRGERGERGGRERGGRERGGRERARGRDKATTTAAPSPRRRTKAGDDRGGRSRRPGPWRRRWRAHPHAHPQPVAGPRLDQRSTLTRTAARGPPSVVSPANERSPVSHELTRLPSGVRVVTETLPHVRSVSLGMWLAVGSRDERDGEIGCSHFLEHLLFKGTSARSAAGHRGGARRRRRRDERLHLEGAHLLLRPGHRPRPAARLRGARRHARRRPQRRARRRGGARGGPERARHPLRHPRRPGPHGLHRPFSAITPWPSRPSAASSPCAG
jgi:predicted RNA-binding protein with RPS1 domain